MFSVDINKKANNGKLIYLIDENSFDFKPTCNCDITLLIGYLNVGVDSETMIIKQIWGLCPRTGWIDKNLKVPKYEQGQITLLIDYKGGTTKRIIGIDEWRVSFDSCSGWVCVGDEVLLEGCICVEFASNIIAILKDKKITALWLKPIYI